MVRIFKVLGACTNILGMVGGCVCLAALVMGANALAFGAGLSAIALFTFPDESDFLS